MPQSEGQTPPGSQAVPARPEASGDRAAQAADGAPAPEHTGAGHAEGRHAGVEHGPVPRRRRAERPDLVRVGGDPPSWEYGGLVLRRYTEADHAAVLLLHRQGLAQVGLRPGDGVYYDHDFFRMQEIYLRGDGEFLVGEVDGRIVAMGGLRRGDLVPGGAERAQGAGAPVARVRDEPAVEMVRLRVRPELQRRGYGEAVVHALEERAAELGYHLLRADTTSRQGPALALYRKFGWRETNREVINGIVNIYIEKRIR
ncbi:GNAT family N-acetyltransferase [Spirillospora sp. NPDC052269]